MKVKHLLSAILVMGAAVLPGASSVRAQEAYFAVTTYANGVDAKPGDGICAAAGGECTLRAVIGRGMHDGERPGAEPVVGRGASCRAASKGAMRSPGELASGRRILGTMEHGLAGRRGSLSQPDV